MHTVPFFFRFFWGGGRKTFQKIANLFFRDNLDPDKCPIQKKAIKETDISLKLI